MAFVGIRVSKEKLRTAIRGVDKSKAMLARELGISAGSLFSYIKGTGADALIKRGLMGIYHNVSKEYLHRYLWQWDFCWNTRTMNDGDRTVAAIRSAEGKRLMYKEPMSD